jgi:hypothetical protein
MLALFNMMVWSIVLPQREQNKNEANVTQQQIMLPTALNSVDSTEFSAEFSERFPGPGRPACHIENA